MIIEKEQELFNEWKKRCATYKHASFVEDGVVCERSFIDAKVRFVFILKEANNLRSSLTEFLRNGARSENNGNGGHTWNPVCRWLEGVDESRSYSAVERSIILRPIAVVDLKKYDQGNARTDMHALTDIVSRDKELLRKQLEIYAALGNVIFVCCGPGMFDLVARDIMGVDTDKIDHSKKPTYCPLCDKAFVLAFNHPNAHRAGLASLFQKYVSIVIPKIETRKEVIR